MRSTDTLHAVLFSGQRLSPAAAVDFGLCRDVYKTIPSEEQCSLLCSSYATLLELYGVDHVHQTLMRRSLRQALYEMHEGRYDFSWVMFAYE